MHRAVVLVVGIGVTTVAMAMYAAPPDAAGAAQPTEHFVPSRPETVSWGWFPLDKPPVLTIASGDTVRIDTLSHAGATQDAHPEVLAR